MQVFKQYFFLLLLLSGNLCFGQNFFTRVSATTIGKNDVVQVEYVAENADLEDFVLPRFTNCTIVSGPDLSSSRMQNGNVVKQETIYSILVQPTTTGTILIPGATARIDNKPKKSNGVSVLVKNVDHLQNNNLPAQPSAPSIFDQTPFEDDVPANQYLKKGEKAIDKIKNNILVRLEVNKQSCYVGEPILATYKLCTRLKSKSKVTKQPTFDGCTVIELTGNEQDEHIEKINGTEYNVFIIRKVQLVPLEAGQLTLPVTSVENKVSFYDERQLNYRDLYYSVPTTPAEEQLVTLQNKPVTIEVKPLPPYPMIGKTEFSGAIGRFDITVSLGEEAMTTSSTNHVLFAIQGEGNVQQVKAPVIKWPKGIEAFDETEQEEDDKTNFPVKSRKVMSFPFVVDKKGKYVIPPIEFTYFDAAANKYITKATNAVTFTIAAGRNDFLSTITKAGDSEGFQNRLYILLGAAFLAVIIGLVWRSGKPKAAPKPEEVVIKQEENPVEVKRDPAEFLFNIRELQPGIDNSYFYKLLCKNLQSYTSARLNIDSNDLALYIEEHPDCPASVKQLKMLLDDCNVGMYTPVFTIEEAMQHRLQAIEILCKLEEGK